MLKAIHPNMVTLPLSDLVGCVENYVTGHPAQCQVGN